MENFKFDLTDEQVCLLGGILDDYYAYACRLYMRDKRNQTMEFFESPVIEVKTLVTELSLLFNSYLSKRDGSSSSKSSRD